MSSKGNTLNRLRNTLPAAPLVLALIGCPGSLDHPERFSDTDDASGKFADCPLAIDVERDLFPAKCGTAGCHDATSKAAGLDLKSADVIGRLKEQVSQNCDGKKLIDTAAIESSVLLLKVTEMPGCGAPMPLGTRGLSSDEYECLRAYLKNGTRMQTARAEGAPR